MPDTSLSFETNLAGLSPSDWTARLSDIADDLGYFEPLGKTHMAAFFDAGPKLLVTFEDANAVRESAPDAAPRGLEYVRREGWSHLALLSEGESWFRDPAVYGYFDRLIDDGFFEDFDQVLFHGAHAAGYAAAAFSVAAPGAHVLTIRPQATLDPRIASFDNRYAEHRRTDFTSRYGYAPEMIEAVDKAYVAFDPLQRIDASHAALFTRNNVHKLRCPGMGWQIDAHFDKMKIHDDLIRAAMAGDLDDLTFARLMRARRDSTIYLRALYRRAMRDDHPVLAANVCAFALRRADDPFLRARLQELSDQGIHPTNPVQSTAAE